MSGVTMTDRQSQVYARLVEPTTARALAEAMHWRNGWNYDGVYSALKSLEKRGLVVRDGKRRDHYALADQWLWRRVVGSEPETKED